MGIVSQKLRDSARGQECTLRIVGICNHDRETTVLAHLRTKGAAGMGQKPDDWHAVFACHACHSHMDEGRMQTFIAAAYQLRALQRTQRIWFEMGLLSVPVSVKKSKKSAKSIPRRVLWEPAKDRDELE